MRQTLQSLTEFGPVRPGPKAVLKTLAVQTLCDGRTCRSSRSVWSAGVFTAALLWRGAEKPAVAVPEFPAFHPGGTVEDFHAEATYESYISKYHWNR